MEKGTEYVRTIVDQEFKYMIELHQPLIDALNPLKMFAETPIENARENILRLIVRHAYVSAFASEAHKCIPAMHYDDVERFARVMSRYMTMLEASKPKKMFCALLEMSGMTDPVDVLVESLVHAGQERGLRS